MITNVYLIERTAAFRRDEDLRRAEQRRRVRLAQQPHWSDPQEQGAERAQRRWLRRIVARVRSPRAVTTAS